MRRRGWKKYLHWMWAWSLTLTLPVVGVFFVWLLAVSERYQTLGVRLDVQGGEANLLHPIMEYEWTRMRRGMAKTLTAKGQDSGLRTVELWVPQGSETRLNEELPASGREYVKAKISHPDGSLGKVSLRYRGDMMHHWALAKKSWRVKTKKKALWNDIRKFNLIVPETWAVLEEHFGYRMATEMGLLAPVSDIVNLRVNGENRGLHSLVAQVDELYLRANGRMPGDLFVGDLLLGDAIPGFENKVFDMPGMWEKAAINNHYPDEHSASMFRLCEVLDWAPGVEKAKALGAILDMEAMGRFAAYRSLVQTGHVDSYHNWKLYYDPWRNRFEPVVWDPNAWGAGWAPTTESPAFEWPLFAELDRVLVHDHRYRWAKHVALVKLLDSGSERALLADMADYGRKVILAAQDDPTLAFSILPSDSSRVALAIAELNARVTGYFDVFRSRHVSSPAEVSHGPIEMESPGEWTIPITLDGWKPIAGVHLGFDNDVPKGSRFFVGVLRDGIWVEYPVLEQVGGSDVKLSQPLLPGVLVEAHRRGHSFSHRSSPRKLTYRLRMVLPGLERLGLTQIQSFDLSGARAPIPFSADPVVGNLEGDFGVLFRTGRPAAALWSGRKTLSGLTEIHGDLHIEAGTILSMGEGASVIVHGQVSAVGEDGQPIVVRPATTDQEPWGTFAIRTPGADGSRFEHVHFSGGSGYKDGLQEYSAMFSAHDVDGLRLKNCKFQRGQVVDDMVHVVYGKDLSIQDCVFEDALSDALDLDGCQGRIEDCLFKGSGNDAIDLMMSEIEVSGTTLLNSGDKGVSVGEGSELLWTGGRVERCLIGIQVKDGSLAWIRRATFVSNTQALNAYKKNWQYGGGGHGLVQECDFHSNQTFAEADKHSSWHFTASRTPGLSEGIERLRRVSDFAESLPLDIRARFVDSKLLVQALAR